MTEKMINVESPHGEEMLLKIPPMTDSLKRRKEIEENNFHEVYSEITFINEKGEIIYA